MYVYDAYVWACMSHSMCVEAGSLLLAFCEFQKLAQQALYPISHLKDL